MTESFGIDYSYARPSIEEMLAAGVTFACRYLSQDARGLTLDEASRLLSAGISIPLVYESTAERALSGYTAGVRDAQYSLELRDGLRVPEHLPTYFAVDFDASEAQQIHIDSYLGGASSVMGLRRTGVYGSYYVVKRCSENGSAEWFWQTYAWSGIQWFSGNHIYQYHNGQWDGRVDFNKAYGEYFGQWALEEDTVDVEARKQIAELNSATMKRFRIIEVASGEYNNMLRAYNTLKAAGFVEAEL